MVISIIQGCWSGGLRNKEGGSRGKREGKVTSKVKRRPSGK